MRLKVWYKNLTPAQHLSISFLITFIIWFIGSLAGDKMFFLRSQSLAHHIFNATLNAFFMTSFFNWEKVKLLFKRENKDNIIVDKE